MSDNQPQAEQVHQAALAMVRPTTDATTRSQASQFLETWTRTPEAWPIYIQWLHSFVENNMNNDGETLGMQLLCVTLLQAKIRREVPRGTSATEPSLVAIRKELWDWLSNLVKNQQQSPALTPCCICLAAITVRCAGALPELIQTCCPKDGNVENTPRILAFKLLASIPAEVEACSDLTTSQVTAELWPYLEPVLHTVRLSITSQDENIVLNCLQALRNWSTTCHISLSHFVTPTCGSSEILLPILLSMLSSTTQPRSNPQIYQFASQALTEVIMVPTDLDTPERQFAAGMIWKALNPTSSSTPEYQGFISHPMTLCNQNHWWDAAHALSVLACTFVNEHIDDIVSQPAEECLTLLLNIQSHPNLAVATTALECWLMIQDVSTSMRHEHWRQPLFRQVLERVILRSAYPTKQFTQWDDYFGDENGVLIEESDFDEFRRMAPDGLVATYYLMRVEYVQMLIQMVVHSSASFSQHSSSSTTNWTTIEAALYGLTSVSKEITARIKGQGGTESMINDRQETARVLWTLATQLCTIAPSVMAQQYHPLVVRGVVQFIGSFAPAWDAHCTHPDIVQLLLYLQAATSLDSSQSSKAIRALCIACKAKLISINDVGALSSLWTCLKASFATILDDPNNNDDDPMTTLAEGETRLLVQFSKESNPAVAEAMSSTTSGHHPVVFCVLEPLLTRSQTLLSTISSQQQVQPTQQQVQDSIDRLARCLHVLQIVLRFGGDNIVSLWSTVVGPFLEAVAQSGCKHEPILAQWIAIHRQLLRTGSTTSEASNILTATLPIVVNALEQTLHPSTLEYIGTAVELMGGATTEGGSSQHVESFTNLLQHVTNTLLNPSKQHILKDSPQLIQSYYECAQRYLLFCPSALVGGSHFEIIVNLAIDYVSSGGGGSGEDKGSTRACLIFVSQLFGWRVLRLSPATISVLEAANNGRLDPTLARHGRNLVHKCLVELAGGSQALWPALSDCLVAIVSSMVLRQDGNSALTPQAIHEWLTYGMSSTTSISEATRRQVITILLELVKQGPKGRPKAKMLLTDYAKIAKGEMTSDALISYAMN